MQGWVARFRHWVLAALGFLLLAGCATVPEGRTDLLDFLTVGKTTREEVILSLGQPSASFEHDRILTYRLGTSGEKAYYIVSPKTLIPSQAASWDNVTYSLVILFDDQGRYRKHQLVHVQ